MYSAAMILRRKDWSVLLRVERMSMPFWVVRVRSEERKRGILFTCSMISSARTTSKGCGFCCTRISGEET